MPRRPRDPDQPRSFREALVESFWEMGGVPALVKWGKANPSRFYRLCGRLIPAELKLAVQQDLSHLLIERVESREDLSQATLDQQEADEQIH